MTYCPRKPLRIPVFLLLLLIVAACAGGGDGRMVINGNPVDTPTIEDLRQDAQFQTLRDLYPEDFRSRDFSEAPNAEGLERSRAAVARMQSRLDHRATRLASAMSANRNGIAALLDLNGVDASVDFTRSFTLSVRDDGLPWSHATPDGEIRLGLRTLRGLAVGGLIDLSNPEHEAGAPHAMTESAFLAMSFGQDPWSIMRRISYPGGAPLEEDAEDVSPDELESRLYYFLEIAAHAEIQSGREARGELIRAFRAEDDDTFDRQLQPTLNAEALISGQDELPYFAGSILPLGVEYLFSRYDPAEAFLIGHELGHVVLGHGANATCEQRRQAEDEADAFAAVMLAFDVPLDNLLNAYFEDSIGVRMGQALAALFGDEESREETLTALRERIESRSDREQQEEYAREVLASRSGHGHYVRYGSVFGGVQSSSACAEPVYRPTEERIQRLDRLAVDALLERIYAAGQLYLYLQEHPPVASVSPIRMRINGREINETRGELEQRARDICGTEIEFRRRTVREATDTMDDDRVTLHWRCAHQAPDPSHFAPQVATFVGSEAFQQFQQRYSD